MRRSASVAGKETRIAAATCIAVAIAAAIAFSLRADAGPNLSPLLPSIGTAWALCDMLAAVLSCAFFRLSRHVIYAVAGAAYAASSLLTFSYTSALFFPYGNGTRTLGDAQLTPAFCLLRHVLFASIVVAGCLYDRRSRGTAGRAASRQAIATAVAAIVGVSGALTFVVYAIRSHLPILIVHGVFTPLYAVITLPAVIALSLTGCALLWANRSTRGLPLWLNVAVFTSMLDACLTASSTARWSYGWDAGVLLNLAAAIIVATCVSREMVQMFADARGTTDRRALLSSARMRAVWQLAISEGLDEDEHVRSALETAVAKIRDAGTVVGMVCRFAGDSVVIDAVAHAGDDERIELAGHTYAAGRTMPPGDDVPALIVANRRTMFWPHTTTRALPFGARCGATTIIGTPIITAGQIRVLLFASPVTTASEAFSSADAAFVELVAASIGRRCEQRAQFERLQTQVERDALTGLYTRAAFTRLGHAAAVDGSLAGIVLIDLDGFRGVNERTGQQLGDELLGSVGTALARTAEPHVAARLGSDDFAVLLYRDAQAPDGVETHIRSLHRLFQRPFASGAGDDVVLVNVRASLGAVHLRVDDTRFDQALVRAHVALDASKARGGDCATTFGPELESVVAERSLERAELHAAIEGEQLFLEYQPTFELNTRAIVGAEALIRWRHPERGLLAPGEFLDGAKRANLLVALTIWVIRRIAADFAAVELPRTFRCYFNVPAHVLESKTLLGELEHVVRERPGLAANLGLEITESEVMNNVEQAIDVLHRVRRLGLLVAVDDFGTGYSSLSYLKRLPVDIVKLDKSFISGLPGDKRDVAVAEMFLGLTRQFSLISVGEGIETDAQMRWLAAHGCMIGQGFFFSRPVAFDVLIAQLRAEADLLDRRTSIL